MDDYRFGVHRDPAWGGYAVYMVIESPNTLGFVSMLEVETVNKSDAVGQYRDPTMRLSDESAQQLMDEMWRAGIRPNNGEATVAHVEAMRAHLNDMRAIVSSKLGVDL